jgi:nucleoside-diphosphate-sugar epimerase
MNSRILLTGATGFIGSAVARAAVNRGHHVLGLIRPQSFKGEGRQGQLEFIPGTLEDAPWTEISRFKPDVCIHTAWISTPGLYLEAPENRVLVGQSHAFLKRAMEEGAGFSLVLGTCIEYGTSGEKLNETSSAVTPVSLYARSKNELREILEQDGIDLSWGRVFYPYGVGEHPQRLCSSIIAKLLKRQEVLLKTPNSIKDYIHVSDLAAAIVTIVERRSRGVINLGTGEGTSVMEIARMISGILECPELVRAATEPSPDPYPYVVADARRLKALGWQPKVSLKEGISALIECLNEEVHQ